MTTARRKVEIKALHAQGYAAFREGKSIQCAPRGIDNMHWCAGYNQAQWEAMEDEKEAEQQRIDNIERDIAYIHNINDVRRVLADMLELIKELKS